ncbi:MAG: Mur ligase family protein, partial [Clostridia bacterium]|nr:Mur ligase family protein [Clostridia bacterium]
MLLGTLLQGVEYTGEAPEALEINDVTADSRKACRGGLFVCIAGAGADGHDYAPVAAQAGCVAIVAERLTAAELPHILVKNPRLAYALICANFFGNPAESLRLVGVTGTNGKTTTTFILKHILEENGHKCGLIGTIRNMAGEEMLPARYTTPEPYELQRLFAEMVKHGCDYVVMEVSSQALAQERVAGCRFVAGVFTNLTQDHLDYHKTMENYYKAKLQLFRQRVLAVVNLDDGAAHRLLADLPCRAVTYSARHMEADYTARNIRYRVDGTDYD